MGRMGSTGYFSRFCPFYFSISCATSYQVTQCSVLAVRRGDRLGESRLSQSFIAPLFAAAVTRSLPKEKEKVILSRVPRTQRAIRESRNQGHKLPGRSCNVSRWLVGLGNRPEIESYVTERGGGGVMSAESRSTFDIYSSSSCVTVSFSAPTVVAVSVILHLCEKCIKTIAVVGLVALWLDIFLLPD